MAFSQVLRKLAFWWIICSVLAIAVQLLAQNPFPDGERTAFAGWGANGSGRETMGRWDATVFDAAGTNFNGRIVEERDPAAGNHGPDTCHFAGSVVPAFTAITGGQWTIGANGTQNQYGEDLVGWGTAAVNYYRNNGRAPCNTQFPQRMFINNPGQMTLWVPYGTANMGRDNTLGAAIAARTVSSTRAGITRTRNFP